ncbi:MAG: hypothetical protein AB8G23_19630 [Myxococcota bacterium]
MHSAPTHQPNSNNAPTDPRPPQRHFERLRGGAVAIAAMIALVLSACASGPNDRSEAARSVSAVSSEVATSELTAGWNDFLGGLAGGRQALENPAFFPPEPTDRNLAEGYRYLLGHLARIIEAQTERDPRFPYFQRSVRMLSKWTIDNPDTLYLSASIDAEGLYQVRGRARDTTQWRSGERGRRGPHAPRVAIFQTTTALVGQTGKLEEMAACRNQTLDSIEQFELDLDAEGRFEILIGAERPADYDGHFLVSRKEMPCVARDGTTTRQIRDAALLNVREIFSDWANEEALELEIVRLDQLGAPRPPRTSAEMGHHLSEIGRLVSNQIQFWNLLHEFGLEVAGDRNGDGRLASPRNDLNPAAPPFIAGGTAGARQLYSAGVFELPEDEALIVKVLAPLEPYYVGFQLANLWGESLDQRNYVSSQTGTQNSVAADGARYYIIAAKDPGTPGWLDTTGLPKVAMSMRFIYRGEPGASDLPTIETTVAKIDRVRDFLPADTPRISPAERRGQVDVRQRHIQRRWRQY